MTVAGRTHGLNHSPLPANTFLDPGFCEECDRERGVREALAAAFSGDEFEENAAAAAGEGEWAWFRWLAVSTVDNLDTLPAEQEGPPCKTCRAEPGEPCRKPNGDRYINVDGTPRYHAGRVGK